MKVVSADKMRSIDQQAIDSLGIPGSVLMENAGSAVARECKTILKQTCGKTIIVLCGKGNNGGDGFVAARHLKNLGAYVHTFCTNNIIELRGDAKNAANWYESCGEKVETIKTLQVLKKFKQCDLIVDALLGTGTKGPAKDMIKKIINWTNEQNCPIVSADIPSGLIADSAEITGSAIKADATITMGWSKFCMHFYPAKSHVGRLVTDTIGFPWPLLYDEEWNIRSINSHDLRQFKPRRSKNSHKSQLGKLLIVAGSTGMTGAAVLCCQSAMRSGAGLVNLACPASLNAIFENKLIETMTWPLDDNDMGCFCHDTIASIQEKIKWADVIALGPGIGTEATTQSFVKHLIAMAHGPLIIDADGLNALANHLEILSAYGDDIVITPHVGEYERLFDEKLDTQGFARIEQVKKKAKEYNIVIHLKGAPSLTVSPDGEVIINDGGNPGMATAGSGDVLTGCIASMIGQGLSSFKATAFAAWLHAKAGDMLLETNGEHGLIARDLVAQLPKALLTID